MGNNVNPNWKRFRYSSVDRAINLYRWMHGSAGYGHTQEGNHTNECVLILPG